MAVQIQIRRGTAANWTSTNPTLAEGELGYETDTGKLKAGDGSTAWTGLSYVSGTGANGTVTSVDVSGGTGLTSSGGPVTSSGTITLNLDDTAVTPGSYSLASITVDQQGRITAASSGTAGGLSNVVEDTTPQLGGNLDVNGQSIVSVSNGNIAITPNGTGSIILDGLNWPQSDGSADQVLKTNGSGQLSFGAASTVAALNDLTDVAVGSEANKDALIYRTGSGWINDLIDYTDVTNNVGSGSAAHSGGTVAAGSITDVIALSNTEYTNLTGGADPNTLYVITGGTTSIADADDVTITSAATNDFLVVDASGDWVDKTPAQVRGILDLEIGTDVQAYSDDLASLASLTTASDRLPYFSGAKTASLATFTAFGRSLVDDADAATARATLGANDASNLTTGTLPAARLPAITDSYVGHIETPADGTYYLDPKVAEAREITGVYFAWTAGGSPDGDIDVQIGGTSVLSSTGRMNSGSSFTGTIKTDGTEDVAADAVITVVLGAVNGVADVTDLRFSVEYAQ